MSLAALQGRNTGRDDRRGRVEVGFADLKVDDVPSLRLERPRLREDLESGLRSESRHA